MLYNSQVLCARYSIKNSISRRRGSAWSKLKKLGVIQSYDERPLTNNPNVKRERVANYTRQRKNWITHVQNMTAFRFRRMYRMSHNCFMKLYTKIKAKISIIQAKSRGGPVWPVLKLAMTLRFLAGGSYLDITDNFGVSDTAFYRSVWLVCSAIDSSISLTFPTDLETLKKMEKEFADKSKVNMRGCVGAVDGLLVKIQTPPPGLHPRRYYTRKRFHALNVQVHYRYVP